MEKKVDLKKLFDEKRYSEIILLIDHKIPEKQKNSALINLVGVCKLLKVKKVGKNNLSEAIEDFRKAYQKEKRTKNALEAFRNFINTSVDLYDFENTNENHQLLIKNFEEALDFFKNDQNYFSNDPQLLISIIRIYNRLVDLDKVRFYLNLLVEKNILHHSFFVFSFTTIVLLNTGHKINFWILQKN